MIASGEKITYRDIGEKMHGLGTPEDLGRFLTKFPINKIKFREMRWENPIDLRDAATPDEAKAKIEEQRAAFLTDLMNKGVSEPRNLEELAISLIGKDIYEILVWIFFSRRCRITIFLAYERTCVGRLQNGNPRGFIYYTKSYLNMSQTIQKHLRNLWPEIEGRFLICFLCRGIYSIIIVDGYFDSFLNVRKKLRFQNIFHINGYMDIMLNSCSRFISCITIFESYINRVSRVLYRLANQI